MRDKSSAARFPFRIKVCGLTTPADVAAAAAAGVEAVGLNFVASSPRCVPLEAARPLAAQAHALGMLVVGVFVNASSELLRQHTEELGLDFVQLHGDESPESLLLLADLPVVKALRLGDRGLAHVARYLERCQQLGCLPQAVLLDALVPGVYGGTGKTVDWGLVARYSQGPSAPPLLLAGGLTPVNVAEAIVAVRPWGVDTASGVEHSPGRKDHAQLQAFVAAAKAAFTQIAG